MPTTDVVVIGGGQAGLAMSAVLSRDGVDHIVLERDTIAARWRERWDSFTLVTPNWTIRLPDGGYDGQDPDGFLPRDQVVAHLERYAAKIGAPVVSGVEATAVTAGPGDGYTIATSVGPYQARRAVVVACGTFQEPKRPALGSPAKEIVELHSSVYRNPDALPPGGVLVVGSAQSGCQIAEELLEAGRPVYLAVSRAQRLPRRYRGRDVFRWAEILGILGKPVEALDSPAERFEANPHISGKGGGRTLNLHRLARDGAVLTGRLTEIDGRSVTFAADLRANVEAADGLADGLRGGIDKLIAEQGLEAPAPDPADDHEGQEAFEQRPPERLDLAAAGVTTILWSAGYRWDFSWVRPARLDEWGYPIQPANAAARAGLHFVGLHFLHYQSSALLYGVGREAEAIGASIAGRPT